MPAAVLLGGTETAEDVTEPVAATKACLLVMAGLLGCSLCPGCSVIRLLLCGEV